MTFGGAPASDLDSMLRGAGVPVEIDGICGYGIQRQSSEPGVTDELGTLPGSGTSVTVRTGAFPGLAPEVSARINGKLYRVISQRMLSSGLTRIYLIDLP